MTDVDIAHMSLSGGSPCIAAVPPVTLVLNETISLVASMRKQSRWTSSSVAAILGGAVEASLSTDDSLASRWGLRGNRTSVNDNPLLIGFSRLRQDLLSLRDFNAYDTTRLLAPFLEVVKSSHTTGTVTSLALNSISKFFSYGLIHKQSPQLGLAMKQLSSAITHCRFEASDSGQDEIVLLRILLLMQEMLTGCGGELLGDESICEMMETGLSMCCQMRLSEMLRRSAEMVMLKMLQVVFLRLRQLDPTEDVDIDGTISQTTTAAPTPITSPRKSATEVRAENGETPDDVVIRPYGIMSIRELLRVLVLILDPHNRQHTDSMRIMAFRLIEVAFEVGGSAIAQHPSLRTLAADDMCRYLFQLVRSDNPLVLQGSLRVISTLIQTMREHLKLQQELFLNYIVACLVPRDDVTTEPIDPAIAVALPKAPRLKELSSGRSTPVPIKDRQRLGLEGGARGGDDREAMIECIGSLLRIPTYMLELFINYDCNENLGDLCQDVIGFLCRNAFPDAALWSTTNVPPLCLDALLGYITFMHARLDETQGALDDRLPAPEQLLAARHRKETIMKACAKFNEDPKQGLAYLIEHELVDPANETKSLAVFLFDSTRINKKLLGEYLSKPKHLTLLQAFVRLFDFKNKRIDEALRMLLQKFRLPGEAQQIERVVEQFSSIYFSSCVGDVKSSDAAFVLSYAVIMLNTDQHNPQAKKSKMTTADFAKNLRGTNDGEDFATEYLQQIYDEIHSNEIIMPEEHDTSASFDYAWKALLAKVGTSGELLVSESNRYDKAMFEATWRPLVATLSFVFASATDDAVFARVMGGLTQCADIAARYQNHEALDRIVASLARLTPLSADQLPGIERNTSVEVDSNRVTVSQLSVLFGRDFKAQLATVLLFRICQGHLAALRMGWKPICDVTAALLINSLLPQSFSPIHQFMKISPIPLPPSNKSSKAIKRNQEASFFTSLSSYLSSYASDEPPQPTDEEIESTMGTIDCVTSCQLDKIRDEILSLSADSAEQAIYFLLQPTEISAAKASVTSYLASAQFTDSNGEKAKVYDPSELLKLELATAICIKDAECTKRYAGQVVARLRVFVAEATSNHFLVTERILSYLLRILLATLQSDVANEGILKAVAEMDEKCLKQAAVTVAYGLFDCLQDERGPKALGRSQHAFEILRKLSDNPDAAPLAFENVALLAATLHRGNFSWLIRTLDTYATAGGLAGAVEEKPNIEKASPRNSPRVGTETPKDDRDARRRKEATGRACRALELLYQMRLEMQDIVGEGERSSTYWQPLLNAIRSHCLSPCRLVKQDAFKYLQRLVLSFDLSASTGPMADVIFDETLIDLIEGLVKLEPGAETGRKPKVLEESKVQAASLLARAWLHHLTDLSRAPDFDAQWHRVLGTLLHLGASAPAATTGNSAQEKSAGGGGGNYLSEAVTESLKNVLLVMLNSQCLGQESALYAETQQQLAHEGGGLLDLDALVRDHGPRSPRKEKAEPSLDAVAAQQPPPQMQIDTDVEPHSEKEDTAQPVEST